MSNMAEEAEESWYVAAPERKSAPDRMLRGAAVVSACLAAGFFLGAMNNFYFARATALKDSAGELCGSVCTEVIRGTDYLYSLIGAVALSVCLLLARKWLSRRETDRTKLNG